MSQVQEFFEEYPPKSDLREELSKPLPFIPPGTVPEISAEEATKIAAEFLDEFNAALASDGTQKLASLFHADQAYWRDLVALTSHIRNFDSSSKIAPALLETRKLRASLDPLKLVTAMFVAATPVLQFIQCRAVFKTSAPGATCTASMLLLPIKTKAGHLEWKIWILSTWIDELDVQEEDEKLLQKPADLSNNEGEELRTDVLIIGGGSAGLSLAARLKTLNVDFLVLDKKAKVGDCWALRYDYLRLHTPTSYSGLPFQHFKPEYQTPNYVTKDQIAEYLQSYVANFGLNVITAANVVHGHYNTVAKLWTVKFQLGPSGKTRTVTCKELVQATGFVGEQARMPVIKNADLYRGESLHSCQFRNAKLLADHGAKSVLVVGSANTAFDVIEDCHFAGLQTTMNVRSPTWLFPSDYIRSEHGLGKYDSMPVDVADYIFTTVPIAVQGQMNKGLFTHLASQEPDRYEALKAAGFPVVDCRDPEFNIMHILHELLGKHYVDTGVGFKLVADGKVKLKAMVEPVAYTETGVRFSDGTTVDADVILWCTGFQHRDPRVVTREMLGWRDDDNAENNSAALGPDDLGPEEISARMDAQWDLDAEGEPRGTWKRHLRVDHFWNISGDLAMQRFYSRILAQQIKLSLEGILPPAYRDTPEAKF